MQTFYVDAYSDIVQNLADAFVKTMHFIANRTATNSTGQMPPERHNIDLTKVENVGAGCEDSPRNRTKGVRHGGQCQAGRG
jgi:hypothetical protein